MRRTDGRGRTDWCKLLKITTTAAGGDDNVTATTTNADDATAAATTTMMMTMMIITIFANWLYLRCIETQTVMRTVFIFFCIFRRCNEILNQFLSRRSRADARAPLLLLTAPTAADPPTTGPRSPNKTECAHGHTHGWTQINMHTHTHTRARTTPARRAIGLVGRNFFAPLFERGLFFYFFFFIANFSSAAADIFSAFTTYRPPLPPTHPTIKRRRSFCFSFFFFYSNSRSVILYTEKSASCVGVAENMRLGPPPLFVPPPRFI